jgi:Protein of unknown function (DUF2442)
MEGVEFMSQDHFTIRRVKALGAMRLALDYADGQKFEVDIEPIVKRFKVLKPMLDAKIFKTASVVSGGFAVRWACDDNLELAADNLRARAIEQSGQYSHEFLWNWMHKHEFTLDTAAAALGLSRRMIAYYRSGEKPLPTTVALACHGYDALAVKAA